MSISYTIVNDELRQAFQDGCKKIVDKLTALGYTPEDPQGPDEINTEIDNIYRERYTKGYEDGVKKTSTNAKIVYIYHKHKKEDGTLSSDTIYSTSNPGGCYGADGHTHNATGTCGTIYHPGTAGSKYLYCTTCGWRWAVGDVYTACPKHPGTTVIKSKPGTPAWTEYTCGDYINTWIVKCGKNSSTIESATITFD